MSSRDQILAAVKNNQPPLVDLPAPVEVPDEAGDVKRFQTVLESIGGKVYEAKSKQDVAGIIATIFPDAGRVVSSVSYIDKHFIEDYSNIRHHSLHDVDVVIVQARLGVAENGAVWLAEKDSKIRVLPFIGENLVALVAKSKIVPTMHQAYDKIGTEAYGYSVFIAGPSKTADIEQSLVLGAHGPKTMHVIILSAE